MMESLVAKPPLLSGTDVNAKREEIKQYFLHTYTLYEKLFDTINNDEAYYLRPEPLRHPLIFYYGHTAAFFINKLILGKYIDARIDKKIESICAVGVDEMSWDDLNTDHYEWPSVADVRQYRRDVEALVCNIIDTMPLELPIQQHSLAWVILMGAEHERIHVETSSVIMRMLPTSYLTDNGYWAACDESGVAPDNELIAVEESHVVLGKPASNETYGWDNEYGELPVDVASFDTSKYLVSNQEFMAFVDDGGYNTLEYWTEEGQNWLSFTKAEHPRFWFKKGDTWYQRNFMTEMPLPLNWPVEVNYLEAKAFCNWKSKQTQSHVRLPTEAEWQVLRNKMDTDLPDWTEAPGNINLEYFASSMPVNRFETDGVFDVIGNVWQWTESPIDGYPGFNVHPLYDDFSTPTFDGKHNLIKGGSWVSTGNEATRDSRYAFRRHFFQHAGFRYVRSDSADVPVQPMNEFEMDQEISRHLERHYGPGQPALGQLNQNSQITMVDTVLGLIPEVKRTNALDLGCSVGRGAFELAKHFDHVDGIDFTARNIQHSLRLKEQGQVRYAITNEGEIVDFREISIKDIGYADIRDKVDFCQGDAHNLKPLYSGYDLIICNQLLDYLYNPSLFLKIIDQRLNAGGYLAINTAWQWNTGKTERDEWLGGVKINGENYTGIDALTDKLSDRFERVASQEMSSVAPLNARKFDVELTELTIWRLK